MAGNRNIKINQPGVIEQDPAESAEHGTVEDNVAVDSALEAEAEQDDDETDSRAAAVADDEARIEAEVQRRMALRSGRKAGDLPHQSEIDATKIKRAVLTQDGYVVPYTPPQSLEDKIVNAIQKAK